jgi:hypothetical protein
MRWTEQAKQMFFLVSYNIDKFRDFVFESSFLQRTPVEEQTLSRLRGDDAALLEFGLGWLKGILFKDKAPEGTEGTQATEGTAKRE